MAWSDWMKPLQEQLASLLAGESQAGTARPAVEMALAVTTPASYNVPLTNADTEYSQALPANCRLYEWQCRTEHDVRHAFVTGKVAGSVAPYHTLKAGDYDSSPQINQGASPSTLYFASATAGVVVELKAWT